MGSRRLNYSGFNTWATEPKSREYWSPCPDPLVISFIFIKYHFLSEADLPLREGPHQAVLRHMFLKTSQHGPGRPSHL